MVVRKEIFYSVYMDAFSYGGYIKKGEYVGPVSLKQYGVELHLVRHGEDERGKVGGWSDNHLTENGIKIKRSFWSLMEE